MDQHDKDIDSVKDEGSNDAEQYGGGDDDDDSPGGNQKGGKPPQKRAGRRKINIEFIKDKSRRHITFSKRKAGIMKKAYELSTLTGTQVLLLVASETGHVYTFATPKLQPLITKTEGKNLIQACLNAPDPTPLGDQDAGLDQGGPIQGGQNPGYGGLDMEDPKQKMRGDMKVQYGQQQGMPPSPQPGGYPSHHSLPSLQNQAMHNQSYAGLGDQIGQQYGQAPQQRGDYNSQNFGMGMNSGLPTHMGGGGQYGGSGGGYPMNQGSHGGLGGMSGNPMDNSKVMYGNQYHQN